MKEILLDGKLLSQYYLERIKTQVEKLLKEGGRPPGLAVILVGEDPASKVYVSSKEKKAQDLRFYTDQITLPASISKPELHEVIRCLNDDKRVDGILLQLPLPKAPAGQEALNSEEFLNSISPHKDVDCLNYKNQGKLFKGQSSVYPCTPLGVLKLIDLAYLLSAEAEERSDAVSLSKEDLYQRVFQNNPHGLKEFDLSGKRAVVVGRSELVGKPLGLMLLQRNATVTYAHSRTSNLEAVTREADIIVAACGVPKLITEAHVKDGAIVIDVGTNKLSDSKKLIGDVVYDEVKTKALAITPVPGGVGPMTITMLLQNTFNARVITATSSL
jgi:methylenetetrahydrofolate dehydrogenase (NADP+) / methenyltetrahydrofolate cyclohydrolase